MRVQVVGVPFNSSGREDGVARAPAALRAALEDGGRERLLAGGRERIHELAALVPAASAADCNLAFIRVASE